MTDVGPYAPAVLNKRNEKLIPSIFKHRLSAIKKRYRTKICHQHGRTRLVTLRFRQIWADCNDCDS